MHKFKFIYAPFSSSHSTGGRSVGGCGALPYTVKYSTVQRTTTPRHHSWVPSEAAVAELTTKVVLQCCHCTWIKIYSLLLGHIHILLIVCSIVGTSQKVFFSVPFLGHKTNKENSTGGRFNAPSDVQRDLSFLSLWWCLWALIIENERPVPGI